MICFIKAHLFQLVGYYSESYEFEGNSLAASFTIGNQWQWENLSIGCDWIGLAVPLSYEVTRENVKVASAYSADDMKYDQQTYLNRGKLQLLRLYVGYSF